MSKIKLTGESSGYVEISAGNAAGNNTLEAPTSGTRLVAHEGSQDVTLNGNLTVNGVVSYEDVTNIDSVGVVTARNGLQVTGGNVGIGITNSTVPLFVQSDSPSAIFKLASTTDTSGYHFAFGWADNSLYHRIRTAGGANDGFIIENINSKVSQYFASSGDWSLSTNSSTRLTVTSDGFIGINNTSPELQSSAARNLVIGTPGSGGQNGLTICSNTSGTNNIYFGDASSGQGESIGRIVYSHADDSLTFHTVIQERLRITSDGKIGVNNTSPLSDLQVITAGQTEDGTFRIGGSAASLGLVLDYDQSGATVSRITANPTYTNTSSLLKICVDGDANPNQLVLQGDGDVGIGTDSPGRKVEIFDTAATVLQLNSTNSGGTSLRIQNSGTDKMYMGLAGDFIVGQGNNVTDSAIRASGALLFASGGGTERLRITSDGKMGLGISSPARGGLHIHQAATAELHLTDDTTGSGSGDGFTLFSASSSAGVWYRENADLRFATNNTERLRINSAGFVGINETSPGTHLHVEQDNAHSSTYYLNSDAAILVDNKNASGRSVIKLEHDAAIVWGGSGDSILFSDRESERLRINEYGNTIFQGQAGGVSNGNSGNAAILVRGKSVSGSSTTVDLNISQATSASGVGLEIQESTNSANALATLVFNHGSLKSMIACSRVVTNNWGTDLRFYTHDDSTTGAHQHKVYERMRLDSSGRLGINETSPSSYLTVSRGTSDGVLSILKNDEVSIQIGVWGTGATYARECTINSTRQDGGSYPWLRLAGQDGIRFASDLNNVRGNLNAYGEWRLGVGNSNLISTDQSHTIGNIGVWNTTNAARLQMQERTGVWISFKNGSGNHYGSISQNGGGVSYGSNSDYRLKDNVQNFTGGIELVKRLRPVTFNWNALSGQEDTTTINRGFLAHEVQEIEPGAVDGEKDGMDRVGDCTNAEGVVTQKNVYESQAKDGETWTLVSEEIKDQQLDPAKLVPILTAGLKEAIAKIETLEAAVAALQGS